MAEFRGDDLPVETLFGGDPPFRELNGLIACLSRFP
jgi:hypothetical protein